MAETHFFQWIDHQMVSPCGATGDRSLSTLRSVITCAECLRLAGPQPPAGEAIRVPPERYTPAQRRDLRDAGRRHWDA